MSDEDNSLETPDTKFNDNVRQYNREDNIVLPSSSEDNLSLPSASEDDIPPVSTSEDDEFLDREIVQKEEEPESLNKFLAKCALGNDWTHQSVDQLLLILRENGHKDLPKTARTLLKTLKTVQGEMKCGGNYVYLGSI